MVFEFQEGKEELYRKALSDKGFIHFKNFLTDVEIAQLRQSHFETQKIILEKDIKQIFGVPVFFGTDIDGSKIIQRLPFSSEINPYLKNHLIPKLRAISKIVGPEFRIAENEHDGIVTNHYLNHTKRSFYRMGWHTDSGRDFWSFKKPQLFYNVGIYLDDSPIEKGGLRILPNTHLQNIFQFLFRKFHFLDHSGDASEYCVVAQAGDLTIHDGRLWHRVAESTEIGEASRRRIVYFPFIKGKAKIKNENSKTPLQHKVYAAYFSFRKTY